MYTIFTMTRILKFFLLVYATLMGLISLAWGYPSSFTDVLRWAMLSVGMFTTTAFLLIGWSGYHAPWRFVFRRCPQMNKWFFPDLNGIWYGRTSSNWTIIEMLRKAAAGQGGLELEGLATVDLMEGEIAMEVKAGLFDIRIRSEVSNTKSDSITLSCYPEKSSKSDSFHINYLYRQTIPQPVSTDEGSHEGAAKCDVIIGDRLKMEGYYWTRRKWREAMNTAGMISVERLSERHAPNGVDLLDYARQLANPRD